MGAFKNQSENQAINNKIKVIVNKQQHHAHDPLIRNVMIFEPFFGCQEFLFESVSSTHFQNRFYGPAKSPACWRFNTVHLKCYADPSSLFKIAQIWLIKRCNTFKITTILIKPKMKELGIPIFLRLTDMIIQSFKTKVQFVDLETFYWFVLWNLYLISHFW